MRFLAVLGLLCVALLAHPALSPDDIRRGLPERYGLRSQPDGRAVIATLLLVAADAKPTPLSIVASGTTR